jgi:nucleoside-diphosphate-sugar epimerase
MNEVVFVAGATGAIGTALVPLLVDAGYTVHGTTRRAERAAALEAMGAHPVVVDVFDKDALEKRMRAVAPSIVVHQLTDLPPGLAPTRMADAIPRNARIREEGTRNLVRAALAAGCQRIVAQSIAWTYAPGARPYVEDQPLDIDAAGTRGITVRGAAALESQVLEAPVPGYVGTVLRYGNLYGPRTGFANPSGASPVHVEAAAWAALLAVQRSAAGIFNVAEDHTDVNNEKAKRILGWQPTLRLASKTLA